MYKEPIFYIPGEFAINKHVKSQFDHVPRRRPVVLHQIQCHGNMGVTVVTAKIVLHVNKVKKVKRNSLIPTLCS